MDKTNNFEQLENIKKQIDEVLKQIEKIKDEKSQLRNAEDLSRFEKDIATATDRLAGLLTAKAIQETLDSDEFGQQANELIKNIPQKMESQGLRDVKIKTARGGSVTVKAAYYTKKKRKKKKKKKS